MNFLDGSVEQLSAEGMMIAVGDGTRLQVGANSGAPTIGDKVTVGIRPEHISLAVNDGVLAQVQAVEHLGSESYLQVSLGSGELLTVKVNGETDVRPDEQVQLKMDSKYLHVFDNNGDAMRDRR